MKRSFSILTFCCLSVFLLLGSFSLRANALYDHDSISPRYLIVDSINITTPHHTKTPYITRELGFCKGDTLLFANLDKILATAHNELINTNLFNSVVLTPKFSSDTSLMSLDIAVEESWQFFVIPTAKFADRNFNAWLHSDEPNKFGRISYGLKFKMGNFSGRREQLIVGFAAGYTYMVNIQYILPYVNKAKTWGFLAGITFTVSKETNYGTENDKAVFYRGIDDYSRRELNIVGGIQYRKTMYTLHQFKLLYDDYLYEDTIYKLNPSYSQAPYKAQQTIGFQYYLQIDHRNYASYPTAGHYFDMEFTRLGLALVNDYPNLFTLRSTFRKYWDLGKRWYTGIALNGYGCTDRKYPFYLQYGLGYDRFYVRGYETNLIKTQFYGLMKTNLKYAILPQKVYYLSFLKRLSKFNKVPLAIYANLFADIGLTYDRQFTENNHLSNTALVGYGIGFDITSYYQKDLRIEVTMNKTADLGIYFSFLAPL